MMKKTNLKLKTNIENSKISFKSYSAPEITFETDLETKAGSPLGNPDSDIFLPGFDGPEQ